jgi:hypothetical protein
MRVVARPNAKTGTGIPSSWAMRGFFARATKSRGCVLVTHPLGWELRLMTPDLLRSQVCRSSEEILDTHEQWKAAMTNKGWR